METAQHNPHSAFELSSLFKDLVGELLLETFALTNGFDSLTFEEVGLILEEPFGKGEEASDVFDSCKSIYCLLLSELELNGLKDLPEILKEETLLTLHQLWCPPQPSKPQRSERTLAGDYMHLAELFRSNLKTQSILISEETNLRVVAHFQIVAHEAKVFETIKPNLKLSWSQRKTFFESFFNERRTNFNETTLKIFESHEKQFGKWLFDEKFPKTAALHCLKYLLGTSFERLHPTLFDLGAIFYFGAAICEANPSLFPRNSLSQEKWIEISFRYFRLNRTQDHLSNINSPVLKSDWDQVLEDTQQILSLMSQMQEPTPHERAVA
jgi:hypothetical protein